MTRHPFHLYANETNSGSEDKRPNPMTKDALIALITQEIPRFGGAMSQEPWIKIKNMRKTFEEYI